MALLASKGTQGVTPRVSLGGLMTESITTIRVEDVYPHPKHYREVRPDAVRALADSIEIAGQLEPIRVWRDGDIYTIDAGHHRHAAMKLLGRETIEAIIIDAEDEAASATVMVASNLHFPESEIERSRGTQLLFGTGVRPVDVAKLIGERNTDKVERAFRAIGRINDETAAEDMTIDRLAAIDEFSDNDEAVDKILRASEKDWPRIVADLQKDRKCAIAKAECIAIAEAAGVEIFEEEPNGYHYIGEGREVPEGAIAAYVSEQRWNGTADIKWYSEAVERTETADEIAARQHADEMREVMGQAHVNRMDFIATHYDLGAMRKLASVAWNGTGAFENNRVSARSMALDAFEREINGDTPRFLCSVLADLEALVMSTLGTGCLSLYNCSNHGKRVTAYLDALEADGYEPSELEAERMAEVRAAIAGLGRCRR